MKPFHTIAIPPQDILEGKLTMDILAVDLGAAFKGQGPLEYRDPELFFQKTYITEGLNNLLENIKKRVDGKGGDPVIQLQTPFGGGKTHSLIALMHKAKEWGINRVVIEGTAIDDEKKTLWSIIEEQLTNKVEIMNSFISPGKDNLKSVLVNYQPMVILIDELLEYISKAEGVQVGSTTLASQTLAFMQELTESVSSLEKICLVVTLPVNKTEQYSKDPDLNIRKLQKILGRLEKIYTPVNDDEIAKVINKRLFKSIDSNEALKIINNFIDYADKENILPQGIDLKDYRELFKNSYPFMPEVIDIIYHRWGSFPSFQRTRGVLRILAMVIYNLKESQLPYISLADFNLNNQSLRQELIEHIGNEYNSIIASDITAPNSGSKKVDKELGDSNRGLSLGSRTATSIFMYSFSGGAEKGATLNEVKRTATTLNNPASSIVEALEGLKDKLFYLQYQRDKYYFSNTPNLNRIILNKLENITDNQVKEQEKELIRAQLKGKYFKTYIWEDKSINIPDTPEIKLVVLQEENEELMNQIIKTKGNSGRIYCNTIIFLCPLLNEYTGFVSTIKELLAIKAILGDTTLTIDKEQREQLKEKIEKIEKDLGDIALRAYQGVFLPSQEGIKKQILAIPIYGKDKNLEERIYNKLENNKIFSIISSKVLKDRYIKNEYIFTKQLLEIFYKTPGEIIPLNLDVIKNSIVNGVKEGHFGLGELEGEEVKCLFYCNEPQLRFNENEIIITPELCKQPQKIKYEQDKAKDTSLYISSPINKFTIQPKEEVIEQKEEVIEQIESDKKIIDITFQLPKGKVSDIMRQLVDIQNENPQILISIKGKLNNSIYDNLIETLEQLKINYSEANK